MRKHSIHSRVLANGIEVFVNQKSIRLQYPKNVWASFPKVFHKQFADTASYFFTQHFVFSHKGTLSYEFPPPRATSLFLQGLMYSLPATIGEIPSAHFSVPLLLKKLSNSEFAVSFSGLPEPLHPHRKFHAQKKSLILPMSFGKDSLLTYALARELGLSVKPVFIVEPTCEVQNDKKKILIRQFEKQYPSKIVTFFNSIGNFRDKDKMFWGWDTLITQYTLLYIPFAWHYRSDYLFWSNEQSTNELNIDSLEYTYNPTYEQSVFWTQQLNNLFRMYGVNTKVSSIIEPLHEIAIMYLLHVRYPEVGKYQLSCDSEIKRPARWCQRCYECARVFLFLKAIGVDPKTIGFTKDMFQKTYAGLYYIFPEHVKKHQFHELCKQNQERLFAFYCAYVRGEKGYVIDEFVKRYLLYVIRHKKQLIKMFCTVHSTETIPKELQQRLAPIYQKELRKMRQCLI